MARLQVSVYAYLKSIVNIDESLACKSLPSLRSASRAAMQSSNVVTAVTGRRVSTLSRVFENQDSVRVLTTSDTAGLVMRYVGSESAESASITTPCIGAKAVLYPCDCRANGKARARIGKTGSREDDRSTMHGHSSEGPAPVPSGSRRASAQYKREVTRSSSAESFENRLKDYPHGWRSPFVDRTDEEARSARNRPKATQSRAGFSTRDVPGASEDHSKSQHRGSVLAARSAAAMFAAVAEDSQQEIARASDIDVGMKHNSARLVPKSITRRFVETATAASSSSSVSCAPVALST